MNRSSPHELSTWSERVLSFLFAAGVAMAIYYIAFECLLVNIVGDQTWYLYAAGRVLAGVQLYGPRLTETNPPLIIWLSLVPVLIGNVLHISSVLALKLIVLSVVAGSTAWCVRLLRIVHPGVQPAQIALLGLAIALIELTIQPAEFAQREQLVVALLMPYIVAVSTGSVRKLSTFECCVLGVIGGVAICLKPFHLITFIGLELLLAAWTRSLRRATRPELLAVAITGCAYLLLTRLSAPLYFRQTVPLLTDTYWAFGPYSFFKMVTSVGLPTLVILIAAAVVCWKTRNSGRMPLVSAALLVCSLGASLAFDIQHTGWGYQAFPEHAFLLLGIIWMAVDLSSVKASWLFRRIRAPIWFWVATLSLMAVLLDATAMHRARLKSLLPSETMNNELTKYPAQTRIYIFSTAMDYFPIIVERKLVWSSRFAHLWMLPAIVENQFGPAEPSRRFKALPPERLAELSALQRTDTTEDLEFWKPEVIFLQRCPTGNSCPALDRSFDMLPWFLQSADFAREWSKYKKDKSVEAFDVYTRNH